MTKKQITECLSDIEVHDFEGDLDKVIEHLQKFSAKIKGKGFSDVTLSWEFGSFVQVEGTREETDKEYNKRILVEAEAKKKDQAYKKAMKEKQTLQELATLERLEKKYRKGKITAGPVSNGKSADIT